MSTPPGGGNAVISLTVVFVISGSVFVSRAGRSRDRNSMPSDSDPSIRSRAAVINIVLAAFVATGIPFVAIVRLMLVHFYIRGAFLLDSGLLASLVWHTDLRLTMPASMGGASYFATHFSPLLLLVSGASWLAPLSLAQWFSGFIALAHAFLALGVFGLLVFGNGMKRGVWPWIAAVLAAGFALSGLAQAIMRYPHFETLIPAFFLLFAACRAAGYGRLAIVCFVFGLATREDAGLHYALILGVFVLYRWMRGVKVCQLRTDAAFAVCGCGYAVMVAAVQHVCFPGDAAFVRIYLGDPPFSHLTWERSGWNMLNLLVNRPYILLPAIEVAFWAGIARNFSVMLGVIACLPWLILHLLADSHLASLLVAYYGFPFLAAFAWPLYVLATGETARKPTEIACIFGGLLAAGFFPAVSVYDPGRLGPGDFFVALPSMTGQARTEAAVAAIAASRPETGALLVDSSIAALSPQAFGRPELVWADAPPADTVAWFADGFDSRRLSQAGGLHRRYRFPGTPIHLASKLDLTRVPALAGLIVAEER